MLNTRCMLYTTWLFFCLVFDFCFGFLATPRGARGLLLALSPGITRGSALGTVWDAKSLPAALALWDKAWGLVFNRNASLTGPFDSLLLNFPLKELSEYHAFACLVSKFCFN